MSLSITIDLSDADLAHFQDVVKRAQESVGERSPKEITDAAGKLLTDSIGVKVPEFIATRLGKLEQLINMVHDEGWALAPEDKHRVLTALTYFANPEDVIPDSVPVVGLLDDAIMIELCVRELKHEIEAFTDFVEFRAQEARSRGADPAKVGRAEWLEGRRPELQERMRKRRGGYGRAGTGSWFGVKTGD
jgi:uncharacterized membrane protein YkvA (DUF1232 family)